jgi:hypothetical protein
LLDKKYGTFSAKQIVKLKSYSEIAPLITQFDVTILAAVKPHFSPPLKD